MARKKDKTLSRVIGIVLGIFLASSVFGGAKVIIGHHTHTTSIIVSNSANERLANKMAAARGWGPGQQQCLDSLWTEESGFSASALNSSSGATGIPQLLPSVHRIPPNWSDPRVQIRWGLDYIAGKYGTPCAAWAFETSHNPNWY